MERKRIRVVCPSKGRSGNVKTLKLIPDLVLVVPHDEAEDYRANHPDTEVVATPEYVKGITPTRQWILDEFGECFMIDDDVSNMKRNFVVDSDKSHVTDPAMVRDIIETTTGIARQIGAKVFSFSKVRNPLEYDVFAPIVHTGYMNASFCGFLEGHGLRYDLSMVEGEDHYISCLTVFKHRYCLIDNRYSFITDGNFKSIGGCNGYRTRKDMLKNTMYLRQKFGEAVTLKSATKSKKSVNLGERTLRFPY